jgi:endonuclease YncB( thermonuclease family)
MGGTRRTCTAATALAVLALATAAAAAPKGVLEGRVVGVRDGDDIVLLVGKTEQRIRLANIDAPERGQPWGERAKQALSQRVFGKDVRVNEVTTDRYGRTVGEVYADDVCVNCELVRDGHAWVYRRYNQDPVLPKLEDEARAARRGLWSLPEAQRVPPWEWRHGGSEGGEPRGIAPTPAPATAPATGTAVFTCGTKTYCREMRSCDEARFFLSQCGLTRLDGDGDGVPCEKLCRR